MDANLATNRVRITTVVTGHVVEGVLLASDPTANLIVIDSTPAAPTRELHFLFPSSVQSFQILGITDKKENDEGKTANGADTSISTLAVLAPIDMAALKAREEAAIRKMKERDAQRGKGVTKEAQDIFDWFARTYAHNYPFLDDFSIKLTNAINSLPTRWAEQTIVVNDSVLLEAPYKQENIKAPKDNQAAVPQIKKVLEGFYQKKRAATPLQTQGKPPPAIPVQPRKGG